MILVLAPREEFTLTNLSWIMLHRGISFAIRLDLATTSASIAHLTEHLHRLLDLRHTLRQIVLRLESAVSPIEDDTGDRDTFYHLCHRARSLEKWYIENFPSTSATRTGDSRDLGLNMDTSTAIDADVTQRQLPQLIFSEAVGPDLFFGNQVFDDMFTTGFDITADDVLGMYPDQPGAFGD